MPKIELPPTKSSLRKIREDLDFAYEGYDLLNQKREILAIEIVRHISEIKAAQESLLSALDELYKAYRLSAVDMGSDVVTVKSSCEKRGYFFRIETTKLLGMKLPRISLTLKKPRLSGSLIQTTATYDVAKRQSKRVLPELGRYATITKAIIMLSKEMKKVQRRVNALEKIFIPQHEEAKKYILDRIEEMEREEVFVKKLIRQRASEP